jgi:hypothetical protein
LFAVVFVQLEIFLLQSANRPAFEVSNVDVDGDEVGVDAEYLVRFASRWRGKDLSRALLLRRRRFLGNDLK